MAKFTASVKGGLHANYASSLSSMDQYNLSKNHRHAAQYFSHKGRFEMRQIIDTLVLSGVGATATLNYSEIEPNVDMGGRRNIISTPIINRTVTGDDIADVRETVTSLASDTYTPVPVINGDRNPLGTR